MLLALIVATYGEWDVVGDVPTDNDSDEEAVEDISAQIIVSVVVEDDDKSFGTNSGKFGNDEEAVKRMLLHLLDSENTPQSRYDSFERAVNEYQEDCFKHARERLEASERSDKLVRLTNLIELYEKHIKGYAPQLRQAIMDEQPNEPISRDAGIALNARCHQLQTQ